MAEIDTDEIRRSDARLIRKPEHEPCADLVLLMCDAIDEAGELVSVLREQLAGAQVESRAAIQRASLRLERAKKAEADLAEMTREARLSREATEKAVERQRKAERQVAAVRAVVKDHCDTILNPAHTLLLAALNRTA